MRFGLFVNRVNVKSDIGTEIGVSAQAWLFIYTTLGVMRGFRLLSLFCSSGACFVTEQGSPADESVISGE
jgi:hypothetical protein